MVDYNDSAFEVEDGVLIRYWGSEETVVVPDVVKHIGPCAFEFRNSIVNVFIPDSVISIGEKAFYDCPNLKEVKIGNNLKTIKWDAFLSCTNLRHVECGSVANSIGKAVRFCPSLEYLQINV